MQVNEIKEFIKAQQEQLNVTRQIEVAKIEGFYQGAEKALGAVASFMSQTEAAEKAAKEKAAEAKKETK